MDKLKPCPFCGGKAQYGLEYDLELGKAGVIFCKKCGARGKRIPISDLYCTKEKSTEAWNGRRKMVNEKMPIPKSLKGE